MLIITFRVKLTIRFIYYQDCSNTYKIIILQVAQRQQKKLQQETKNSKKTKGSPMKMNGEASLEKGEESSASSSMNSIDETESKTDPSSLTFQGVLCNGVRLNNEMLLCVQQ